MIKEAFQKNMKSFYLNLSPFNSQKQSKTVKWKILDFLIFEGFSNLLLQKKQQMKCYCYLLQLPENCVSEM